MGRERIGLSYFEAVVHRRFKKVTLMSELKDCFDYFGQSIVLIHGNGIEIKKVEKGKGYSIEANGVVKVVGIDSIPKPEQAEIVRRIRNITIPYSRHAGLGKK